MEKFRAIESSRFRFFLCLVLCSGGILLGLLSLEATPLPFLNRSVAANKIAPWVMKQIASGKQAEFLVVLADRADLSGASKFQTKHERGRFVRDALWNKAQQAQQPILQLLQDRHVEYRSFYIVNMIWVKGGLDLVQTLAARADVLRIEGNPQIHNAIPAPISGIQSTQQPQSTQTIEPGISYTRAPEVWAMGYTGQGIVVAGADTGYLWNHTALINHYRGWNGTVANHDYNWHDSIHDAGATNTCGSNSIQPCDDDGHGTHTMGTAVGDDGLGNQIGMAPGAKWIGCRNMDAGNGTPARYIECMEFFLAPYPVNGTTAQGDSSKAPDISTNSWSCPPSEGCSVNSLQAAVDAQRAAGITMVAAAQNGGPGCSTVVDPPGIYNSVYSIGALTTGTDSIASFSSRGPVTVDGSNRLKPDLCAPGTNTRSSYNTTPASYTSLSGTSMATPHVAGAVALLWSAQPLLRHDVSRTESVLNNAAVHISSLSCSSPQTSPNNVYGYGRLDVKAAVDQALALPFLLSAVSRKNHPGAGTFDVDLPLSGSPGIECRSSGGAHALVFTFNHNVVSGSASVTSGVGSVFGNPIFSGNTMTVNLTGVSNAQKITVTLSGVSDDSSQVIPDTAVTMGVLLGDTTGNGSVNSSDVAQTQSQSGQAVTASNFREDVTLNGSINSSDIAMVQSQSGKALP